MERKKKDNFTKALLTRVCKSIGYKVSVALSEMVENNNVMFSSAHERVNQKEDEADYCGAHRTATYTRDT